MNERNAKILLGMLLGFLIGAGCRAFGIPSPAPGVLPGALLVLAMTLGYLGVDRVMARQARHRELCGGPTGEPASPPRKPAA